MMKRLQVESWQEQWENFNLELTFCADSYFVFTPPCVTAVAGETSQSFCQKCRWLVTPKHTLDPHKVSGLNMLSRHSVGTYQGN